MMHQAGSGHPGGTLSTVEIITVLYFQVMHHNPKNREWEDRDRFILSKGHASACLYAVLAVELGRFNITVNAICPNNVETKMFREVLKARAKKFKIDYNELVQGILSKIPMGRFTRSKDVAGLVAYLASPDAEHITGQAINVCGGRTFSLF